MLSDEKKDLIHHHLLTKTPISEICTTLQVTKSDVRLVARTSNIPLPPPTQESDLELADKVEDTIHAALDSLSSTDWSTSQPHQVASSVATLIDRMRLLRSQSTQNQSTATTLHAYIHYLTPPTTPAPSQE